LSRASYALGISPSIHDRILRHKAQQQQGQGQDCQIPPEPDRRAIHHCTSLFNASLSVDGAQGPFQKINDHRGMPQQLEILAECDVMIPIDEAVTGSPDDAS